MDYKSRLLPFTICCLLACLALPAIAANPTLSSVGTINGGLEDGNSAISYGALQSAADEADADGGAIGFKLKSITSGSMNVSTGAVLNSGNWTWTPPADANGVIAAFTVVAYDGSNESSTPIQVNVDVTPVNDAPSFTKGGDITRTEDANLVTVNGWATAISKGPANESGQAVNFIVTSNSNASLFSIAPAVAADGTLTFTTAPNANGTATIGVKIHDNGGISNGGADESAVQTFTITLTPVNDAPSVGGTLGGTEANPYPDSGTEAVPVVSQGLFNAITITDVDHNNPNNELVTTTVTISRTMEQYGSITVPPANSTLVTTAETLVYTIANRNPVQAQADLRAARFTPLSNVVAVGIYEFSVKIEVKDSSNATATPLTDDVHVSSVNDAPVVTTTLTPASIPDSATVQPFRVTVSDADLNETFSVTITETTATPRGTLSATTVTGNASQISNFVQNISYTPLPQTTTSQTATFNFSVTDIHPNGGSGTPVVQSKTLTITFTNVAPEITGITTTLIRVTDDPASTPPLPFSTVTIYDANASQILTVTFTLDDAAKGTISSPTLTGTAAQITAAIRNLTFIPTPNRKPVNQSETVTITIKVDDGFVNRSNALTKIEVTSVNGAPVVNWSLGNNGAFPLTTSPALISPTPAALPFAAVEIADEGDVVVSVSLDDPAKGTLTSPASAFTETPAGSHIYKFSGGYAAAQTAIRALQYTPDPNYPFPAGQPGRTDFTIRATDSVSNQTVRLLPIVLISDSRNFLVTSLVDSPTLPGSLRHAIANAAANDVITFALPSYPATIRLVKANGPLVINKHLTFKGPGADKLTISGDSNSNGNTDAGDVQIFQITSTVEIDGLRLVRGFAANGGAIAVSRRTPGLAAGSLHLINSTISDCVASQWGGAIDVVEGSISVENSLFARNTLSGSSGLGGAAVSLFTNAACSFTNSTFSANAKLSTSGIGGGALYIENDTPANVFETKVTYCTFAGNSDEKNRGSAIQSNVSNSKVIITNSVFADFSAHNLFVAGGGAIVSQGGNISNDNTTTEFIVSGNPQSVILLNHATDKRNIDPQLNILGNVGGQTEAHSLKPNSPAVGAAVTGFSAIDQRGVVRNSSNDSGAVDANALGRLIIHEISASQTLSSDFIEFYNPRNQGTLTLTNYEVWIDGVKVRTFTDPLTVLPGFGFILGNSATVPVTSSTPLIPIDPANPATPLVLKARGRIEVRTPGGLQTIASASYVNVFADQTAPTANVDYGDDSLTLAPQFGGAAFVPHRLVQAPPAGGALLSGLGSANSPGADTGGTPFGKDNAYPIATLDRPEITEDELATLNVLSNDLDSDASDGLFIIDVNTIENPATPTNNTSALSAAGATVTIDPPGTPIRGKSLTFDPRVAFNSLPEGVRVTDTFAYSIIDVGNQLISDFSANGVGSTKVGAPAHRLPAGSVITISGSEVAAYNGTFAITAVDADSFGIPVTFTSNPGPAVRGKWQAALPRVDTQRATALVEVSILGRNDPPTPVADTVATTEDTVLRILGDPTLVGSNAVFDTDGTYALPRKLSTLGILSNDSDPDTDDVPFSKLRVVGVCQANAITGFSGSTSVTVTSPAHGLTTGARVLISGYGGHPSYNGYHVITVTSPDTFTLPIGFIDDAAQKGVWAILGDDTRLTTTSNLGAAVTLEIRANRAQTNIVYNPRASSYIDGLALGEIATDRFYYAVEDTHGAVSLAPISVTVTGTNDSPVPGNDPSGLAVVNPLLTNGLTLPQFLANSEILHLIPAAAGGSSVAVRPPGGAFSDRVVLEDLRQTDEDTAIAFSRTSLISNDTDIDRNDTLSIEIAAGQTVSSKGATITLASGGSAVNYNPAGSAALQALARGESTIDTFNITIFDGTSRVTSLVAVLVNGLNDKPVAVADSLTTPENVLLALGAPGILANDYDIDQNTSLPDNRKWLTAVTDATTQVTGVKVNTTLLRRDGQIDDFTAVSGNTGLTSVVSPAHGINTGEEVVIVNAGALTGQYRITKTSENTFTIAVPFSPAFDNLSGSWTVLQSTFSYDPRGSVSSLNPADATFTLQGLAAGQTYNDTFTYTLHDGSDLFANDDIFRIEADRSGIELNVLLNDGYPSASALTKKIVAVGPTSAGGLVTLNGSTSLIYTPQTGFVGDEIFTYTIEDSLGIRANATVTARVTINRLNGNLQANNDAFTVAAGQSPLLNVIANDDVIPASGTPLTLTRVTTMPNLGGTAVPENGAIRYTPSPAATVFPYTETFVYEISGGGTATANATVSILVVNRANTLNVRADSFTIPANSTSNPLTVLANDNILPGTGAALALTSVATPAHGTAIISGSLINYTPATGFLGTDTFSYAAADGFGGTGTATIKVTVGYLVTNSDFFSVPFDNPAKTTDDGVTVLNVLGNDGVLLAGGGNVTITAVTPLVTPLGTIAIGSGNTTLTFDPAAGANGQQEFTYTISDSTGRTATSTVTVVVVNSGVRANSDSFTVQTDSLENPLPILANDLRISTLPGTLAISSIGTGPNAPNQGGTVVISESLDQLIYTPASGFQGVESFTYTVTDGDNSDTARVTIRSTSGELVAGADSFFAFRGSSANVLTVLSNDRVIPDNGDVLTITATDLDPSNPSNPSVRGQLAIADGGTALIYTPAPENTVYPYVETFTYEISDGGTRRSEAVVRIEVIDRVGSRNLDTNNDAFTVKSDSGASVFNVLANDNIRPATADGWTITSVTSPSTNVASPFLSGDILAYSSFASKLVAHADPVSLFIWNSLSTQARAILTTPGPDPVVTINTLVAGLNSAVTGPSIYDVTRFAAVTLRAQTVSLLAENPAGEQLIVLNRLLLEDALPLELRQSSGGGSVAISGSNLVYVPQPGFVGYERFTYRVSDGLGGTGAGEVIVRVGDISVSTDRFVTAGNTPVTMNVTANDGILRDAFPATPNPAAADFTLATEREILVFPVGAGTALARNGLVTFTPSSAFTGLATLTYFVKDDSGSLFAGTAIVDVRPSNESISTAVATITVTGVNDAPILLNGIASATTDKTATNPFANATVIEFDNQRQELVTLRISIPPGRGMTNTSFTEVSPGVFEMTGTAAQLTAALRALTFTPIQNRIPVGTTEETLFAVTLDDHKVATPVVVNSVRVTVTPVNDAPIISGTVAGQPVYKRDTLKPLSNVTITEVDNLTLQSLTTTVRIANPIQGFLSGGGFIEQGTGTRIYTFSGTAAESSAALRSLVFEPTAADRPTPDAPETVTISVSVADNFGGTATNTGTTVIVMHAQVDRLLAFNSSSIDASQAAADFGSSVAVSGNTMVVGSPRRDATAVDTGRVYVFERGSSNTGAPWRRVAELSASDIATTDLFGSSVAIDGDTIVVGAPQHESTGLLNNGAAYIFKRNPANADAWTQSARLFSPSAASNEAFGTAVAVQGTTVIVGAPLATVGGYTAAGKVHVYEKNQGGTENWGVSQTFNSQIVENTGEGIENGFYFGRSLAISGNNIVVGAYGANIERRVPDVGAIFVFQRATGSSPWTFDRRIDEFASADSLADDRYGISVDIDGDTIVVGASCTNRGTSLETGTVFIYDRNTGGAGHWGLSKKLQRSTEIANDLFGASVSVSGNLVMVGAPRTTYAVSPFSGNSFVYRRNEGGTAAWGMIDTFSPGAITSRDQFGAAIALDGFTAAIGSIGDSVNATSAANAGSVRVYQFHHTPGSLSPALALQQAYAAWAATRFTPVALANAAQQSTVWGENADPDGDGIVNLVEMLFGTAPGTAQPSPLGLAKNQDGSVTISFPNSGALTPDLYHVEWSTSLGSWSRLNVTSATRIDGNNVQWIDATVHPANPQSTMFARIFVGP